MVLSVAVFANTRRSSKKLTQEGNPVVVENAPKDQDVEAVSTPTIVTDCPAVSLTRSTLGANKIVSEIAQGNISCLDVAESLVEQTRLWADINSLIKDKSNFKYVIFGGK